MAYCRFGPTCDVYAYECGEGQVQIHVAARRHENGHECPTLGTDSPDEVVAWLESRRAWIGANEPTPISLPHAGESFGALNYDEAADVVEMLKSLGYRVDERVIEAIRADAGERAAN